MVKSDPHYVENDMKEKYNMETHRDIARNTIIQLNSNSINEWNRKYCKMQSTQTS
jgi:hypothetical protein